ncbi:hypothetical protein ACP70R_014276 [Stipagrostis hirtigluma subsp. patula]
MPDWRVGEFEGKFKDEFAQRNKKELESGTVTPTSTSSQKLKHEVASENSTQGIISAANNSDAQKCNSDHIQSSVGMVSQDINRTGDCIGDCKDGSNALQLVEENTIVETRCPTANWNTCQFALSNGSSILNNQSVRQDSLSYGDNDLNYIDWPGIDNFEDVDTLFRRCDSTYGQQQLENTDELSWIPSSSDAVYSSDVALQQGFDTSYSDYGILDDLSAFHCSEDKSLPTVDPSVALSDKQFNDDYLFNEQKNVNAYGQQAYQDDAMELLPTDQICNGHGNFDMLDVQTKLCIRDGLYRLARSAQHRQVFPNTMDSNGDSQDAKDMQNAETPRKFVDPRSIETQTNPIDRSIALLLFHQSSDHVAGAVDDASSLKSHVNKKQHQGPPKNQDVLPASSIYSPRGQGGSIDAKSMENY